MRSLRSLAPGGGYPLVSRGDHRETTFHNDIDRRCFLETLGANLRNDRLATQCLAGKYPSRGGTFGAGRQNVPSLWSRSLPDSRRSLGAFGSYSRSVNSSADPSPYLRLQQNKLSAVFYRLSLPAKHFETSDSIRTTYFNELSALTPPASPRGCIRTEREIYPNSIP